MDVNKIKKVVKQIKEIEEEKKLTHIFETIGLFDINLSIYYPKEGEETLEGFYTKLGPRYKSIHINGNLNTITQKLVGSHEFYHGLSHNNLNYCKINNSYDKPINLAELEANYFSAEYMIHDNDIQELEGVTYESASSSLNLPEYIIRLKFEHMDKSQLKICYDYC